MKKALKKAIIILAGIYVLWILISLVLLLVNIPQFHYGNLIGRTYKEDYYPLEDWDYPLKAQADFNLDGKDDYITPGGCANFNYEGPPSGEICEPYYSKQSKVVNVSGEYPIHSYMIKENNQWFIIVLDKKYELSRYAIEKNGEIQKQEPTSEDLKNEAIYLFPLIPFWPLTIPGTIADKLGF